MVRVNFWERTSINVITNSARTAVMALIGVFLIPYYLDNLGASVYAIIPLATTISSYVLLVSDCLISACGRYVIIAIRKGDEEELSKLYNSGLFGMLRICLIILPIILLVSYYSTSIFAVPGDMSFQVRTMFLLVLISSLIVSLSSVFTNIFFAHNMMYKVHVSRLVYLLVQILLIVLLFNITEPSLVDIGFAYLISAFVLIISLIVMSRHLPLCPKINLHHHDKESFRKMGALGAWMVVSKIGSLLYIQISLILVNLYLGTEVQAGFAILSTIISMIGTAVNSISTSFDPILYRLYAEKRISDMIRVIHVGEEVLGYCLAMPIAFLLAFSDEIITVWVGDNFSYLSDYLLICCITCLLSCCVKSMAPVPTIFLKNRWTTPIILVFGILNAILSLLALHVFGYGIEGAIYVWAGCTFCEELGYLIVCNKALKSKLSILIIPLVQSYLIMLVCYSACWGLSRIVELNSWLSIMPVFLISVLIYYILVFRLLLPREDRELVSNMLPGPFKILILR